MQHVLICKEEFWNKQEVFKDYLCLKLKLSPIHETVFSYPEIEANIILTGGVILKRHN